MNKKPFDRRKTECQSGLWNEIPKREGFGYYHENLCNKKDPLDCLEHPKIRICKFTKLPITENRKELHPKHISLTGFCVYCGRLK
jgi:hypothetical protein